MIDSHCHIDDDKFKNDLSTVIKSAQSEGIQFIIAPAQNLDSFMKITEIQKTYPNFIYSAIGFHPSDVAEFNKDSMKTMSSLITGTNIVAVGEIGLDLYWQQDNRNLQQSMFEEQLQLAQEFTLPVIVHSRNAVLDCIEILKNYSISGVFHCYSDSKENAKLIIDKGYSISFTGNITYPKAENLREIIRTIPLDSFFLETDAPYMSPQIKRGKRNEPAFIKFIYDFVCGLKNIEREELISSCEKNIRRLFNL